MKTRAPLLAAVFVSFAASAASQPVKPGTTIVVTRADGTTVAIPSNLVESVSTAARARSIAATLAPSVMIANSAGSAKAITVNGAGLTGALATGKSKAPRNFSSTSVMAIGKGKASPTISSSTATSGLVPGQTLFIGPTGSVSGMAVVANRGGASAISTSRSADTLVVSPRSSSAFDQPNPALASANPLATTIERQVFQSDLARDSVLAVGSTVGGTGDFIIGPNGFPVPITVAGATGAAGQTVIGPNGFPVPVATAQTAPQTAAPVIGSNGFPAVGSTAGPTVQSGLARNIATVPAAISSGTTGFATTGAAAVTTTNATTGSSRAGAPAAGASTTAGTSGSPQ